MTPWSSHFSSVRRLTAMEFKMTKNLSHLLLVLPITALGITACGGGGSSEYDPIATGLSGLMADPDAGETQTFKDLVLAWRGQTPVDLSLDGDDIYVGRRGELDFRFELDCLDTSAKIVRCDAKSDADAKISWKGKIENTRHKLEIDRNARIKVTSLDENRLRIQGDLDYSIQSDFKDKDEDYRHKYDFDADAKYDVVVMRSDGAIESGKLEADIQAKEKLEEDDTKIKSELKTKMVVTFLDGETSEVDFDSKSKYKLHLVNGALELE